jgi:hypothetical protein
MPTHAIGLVWAGSSEKEFGVMGCLRLYDFIKGTEIMISMPRCEHDLGMENSYQNILRSDERTAALIENHERFLISFEKES